MRPFTPMPFCVQQIIYLLTEILIAGPKLDCWCKLVCINCSCKLSTLQCDVEMTCLCICYIVSPSGPAPWRLCWPTSLSYINQDPLISPVLFSVQLFIISQVFPPWELDIIIPGGSDVQCKHKHSANKTPSIICFIPGGVWLAGPGWLIPLFVVVRIIPAGANYLTAIANISQKYSQLE